MATQDKQTDNALKDIEIGESPERINGRRLNTTGENEQLNSHKLEIDMQKKEIKHIENDTEKQKKQVAAIANDIEAKTQEHSQEIKAHNNVIENLKIKLKKLKESENFYKSLLPSFTTETRQKPAAKGKKTGSNIWILLLVTLGLDIITFISTYSLQLEVLNFIEVLSRFLYVLAIFGISALLHILHKRNGKKFVQVMLVSTIALSLITMFHVIYVSLNVPASQVTNDFSFQAEQTIAISESIASRLFARPGLIEMMLAAIFCIAGVICDLSSGKTNDTITETTPKNEPEELSYREKKLAEVRQDITQTESDIKAEQDAIDVSNKNFSVYLNYNHDKLIEIKNTITKNDEEKDKKGAFLNDTMRKIHKEMCDDRLLRIQLKSRKNNIPVSEIAYEEWTLEDIINYYNQQ